MASQENHVIFAYASLRNQQIVKTPNSTYSVVKKDGPACLKLVNSLSSSIQQIVSDFQADCGYCTVI
jgi:hypothetical protein